MIRTALAALTLGLATASAAVAGPITVEKAWVRPAAKGLPTSAAYFVIRNAGPGDSLQAVSSPIAKASVHMSMSMNGAMLMHPMAATPVPAMSQVAFAPGGLHVMLEGLKRPLAAGETTPLTLTFAKAGKMTVNAPVRATAP